MWNAVIACVVCAVILLALYLILKQGGTLEKTEVQLLEDQEKMAVCDGTDHGPTTLGGTNHITCLKRNGHLEMWCHTHNQSWDKCIAKFTGGKNGGNQVLRDRY
jgi:hypothetical protein